MQYKRALAVALGGVLATCSFAANLDGTTGYEVSDNSRMKAVPIQNWAPVAIGKASTRSSGESRKAATDLATVFRPLTPCRLLDTRAGQPSAIGNIGGTIVSGGGTRRTVDLTTAPCGIPNIFQVAGLSLSFAYFNSTVNNGGSLSFTAPGAAATGFNIVFSPGQQWGSTTAAVVTGGVGGDFDVVSSGSTIDLIVDVNGYYQSLDNLDVGTQQLDIVGTTTGDLFEVSNSGASGSAVTAGSYGTGGKAINIRGGRFNVSGANAIGGTSAVYIHEVTAGSINGTCPARTNLSHPMLNGNPNAVVMVTPLSSGGTSFTPPVALLAVELVAAAGNVCTTQNNWRLSLTGSAVVGHRYQIMIITNN